MTTTTTEIVPGSLGAIAARDNISVAESFLSADVIVIVDVSGSMATHDSRGGHSRYEVACEELRTLQARLPGKIAVVAFSGGFQFAPGGVPLFQGDTTNLAGALRFVQVADGTVEFFVISDGEPDSPADALAIAQRFESKISTIYVGPEGGRGSDFLRQLAAASGGQHTTAARAVELAASIERLMLKTGSSSS